VRRDEGLDHCHSTDLIGALRALAANINYNFSHNQTTPQPDCIPLENKFFGHGGNATALFGD